MTQEELEMLKKDVGLYWSLDRVQSLALIRVIEKQDKALRKVEAKARAFHKNNNDYDCILDIPLIVKAAILPERKEAG